MFHDPYHWFPDPYFSTILFIFLVGVYLIDYYIPKMFVPRQPGKPIVVQDRSSFFVIQAVGIGSIVVAAACRYMNWTITPAAVQYFSLLLIPAGLALREWAIIKLGRFFSRNGANRGRSPAYYRWSVSLAQAPRLYRDGSYLFWDSSLIGFMARRIRCAGDDAICSLVSHFH